MHELLFQRLIHAPKHIRHVDRFLFKRGNLICIPTRLHIQLKFVTVRLYDSPLVGEETLPIDGMREFIFVGAKLPIIHDSLDLPVSSGFFYR